MPKKNRRKKQVQDEMPMGRYGRKVTWVAKKDMLPFEECIKEAMIDMHFAIQMYEVELKDQGWFDDDIDKKVKELVNRLRKQILEEE